MSKKGKCFFSLTRSEISFHCSCVGSTPVGCVPMSLQISATRRGRQARLIETHVVGAGVEQDDGPLRRSLHRSPCRSAPITRATSEVASTDGDVALHALKVEADRLLVKVAVGLDLEARVLGDGDVVPPRGRRQVDGLCARVVAREEGGADAERARARDGLRDGDLKRGREREGRGARRQRCVRVRALREEVGTGRTRSSRKGAESAPYASLAESLVKSLEPGEASVSAARQKNGKRGN